MSRLKPSPPPKNSPAIQIDPDPDPDPPSTKSLSPPNFLWSSLFDSSVSSNAPSSQPSYLPDGTPVIIAPPSVILRASSSWEGHLLCRFLGEPPSPAKFFSDLNRVWGKHGDISVRRFSSGTFLVFVPSASTRRWILQTGLWSSGTVSFIVSEWSVSQSLAPPPKLTSATTILTIRKIPPQLWSQEAVVRIAGAVAKLIPGTRASLPLSSLGTATIRAIVPLGSTLPPSVMVKDTHGDSVLVAIDYGRLPHLCSNCNSFGHQIHRCPLSPSVTKPIPPKSTTKSSSNADHQPITDPSPQQGPIQPAREDASLTPTVLQSHTTTPDCSDQSMDLDNKVSGEKVLVGSSEIHPQPSLLPLTTEATRQASSSPSLVSSEQNMELDSKADDGMITKDDGIAVHCPSSKVSEPLGPHTSPTLVHTSLLDPTSITESQDQSQLDIESAKAISSFSSESGLLNGSSASRISDDPLAHHSLHTESFTDHTMYSNIPAKFDLLPSFNTNQEHDIVTTSVVQPAKRHSMGKRDSTRDSKKSKVLHTSLRCIQVKHPYKPKGVVEKKRKKANHTCVPNDEEVHQCLMEIKSDMENTLHFEAIDAIKVLRKFESESSSGDTT